MRRSLGGSGVTAASNWRISSDPYRQIEVSRKGLDNSRKCLETRWRAHPVLPSSMQAKEKMYAHISVGRAVDIELKVIMYKTRSLQEACVCWAFSTVVSEKPERSFGSSPLPSISPLLWTFLFNLPEFTALVSCAAPREEGVVNRCRFPSQSAHNLPNPPQLRNTDGQQSPIRPL